MEGRKEGMTPAGQQSTTQTGSVRDSGLSLRVVLVAAPRSANHLSFFPHETNWNKTLRFVLLGFSLTYSMFDVQEIPTVLFYQQQQQQHTLLLNQCLLFLVHPRPHLDTDLVSRMTHHSALFFEGKMGLLETIYDPVLLTRQEDGQKILAKDRDTIDHEREENDDDENILTDHNITFTSV